LRSTRTRSPGGGEPLSEGGARPLAHPSAAIEKDARAELSAVAVARLETLGLFGAIDETAARAELRELEAALDALEELQSWVEGELEAATAA
jgi:hypothetical protein